MTASIKSQVLDLVMTTGKSARMIAREVGCSKSFVEDVRALAGRGRIVREECPHDDEKHIALIAEANNGRGFPVCFVRKAAA